jgi:hypothetical protein
MGMPYPALGIREGNDDGAAQRVADRPVNRSLGGMVVVDGCVSHAKMVAAPRSGRKPGVGLAQAPVILPVIPPTQRGEGGTRMTRPPEPRKGRRHDVEANETASLGVVIAVMPRVANAARWA